MKSKLNANILVIDDSITSLDFFKQILENENHTVYMSKDGIGYMDLIEKHNIDIILLDVILPHVDGFEILQHLQATDHTKDIPVIMITGLNTPEAVKKALDIGALDFIRKPCEPIELIARIRSAFRLKIKQDLIMDDALRDVLTGLYNRRYFTKTITTLLKHKQNDQGGIALIMVDCDYFKRVNDIYGHTAGDVVLASVANAIAKSVNASDTVCRLGGEEFCILLPNTTMEQAFMVAERVRGNVAKIPFTFSGEKLSVTISCGVSHTSANDKKTDKALLSEADSALYLAKSNGRNQTQMYMEKDHSDANGQTKE